jgi:ISXO2-like transposase domain/Transposase zinc-ribbon domain
MATEPRTLQQAILYFADADNCLNYLAVRRWKNGAAVCPTCGSTEVSFLPSRRLWQCKTRHPKAQFSIKVGTIFEDSPLGLDKWLLVMWQLANCKNGTSSYEMSRATGISQKSCWFMLQRIRLALQDDLTGGNLGGEVEVDETYIGGKARNMHRGRRIRAQVQGPSKGKAIVLGLLERETENKPKRVRATVIADRKKATMRPEIDANVDKGAILHSDEYVSTWGMDGTYVHQVVNHAEEYVNGNIHTNGLENFWSLLKRGINGTYVSVEPFHLFRYIDEQAFRFNNRKHADGEVITDGERFDMAVRQIVGKRLTWAEVTGKDGKKPEVS